MLELTGANFKEKVLEAGRPALVDLWAPWCGPCRMLGPVVEELAVEYEGRAIVAKLNTDDNPSVSAELRASAIPTLVFLKGGKVVDALVGAQPKAAIKAKLDALIAA
jgi:thioredoxin 1